tara:strand:- start:452 stop:583 length:132 start_codon:yes stop_codon:yes gene_type:complete
MSKELKRRIKLAKQRQLECPPWIRASMVWQGGGELRNKSGGAK